VDHQAPQIAITTFADADQAGTTSTGSLFRYKSKPCGELAAILEALSITDRSDQRCRRHRSDAFDPAEMLTQFAVAIEFPMGSSRPRTAPQDGMYG
jgi:hypothetical protein